MSSERQDRYQDYDRFYSQRNREDTRRQQRQDRDYGKKFGGLLGGDRGRSVLDIGCADGRLVGFLKAWGFEEVVGIDLSEGLIEMARKRVDAEFVAGDAQDFLGSGRTFDIIFMLNVLEHIERDQVCAFMAGVCGALRPGGFVVIRVPNMNNILSAGHLADDLTHCTGFTEQSLEQLAHRAGFGQMELLDQFKMQNLKGKVKAILSWPIHKWLFWLRGGTRPRVFYRNLYVRFIG